MLLSCFADAAVRYYDTATDGFDTDLAAYHAVSPLRRRYRRFLRQVSLPPATALPYFAFQFSLPAAIFFDAFRLRLMLFAAGHY